ncbi:MAG: hypothetical protein HOK53_14100, partial [Gammaproteobacteria bacterium]|nr:hypothetical protein [Gammaproteobacteria bacterium]
MTLPTVTNSIALLPFWPSSAIKCHLLHTKCTLHTKNAANWPLVKKKRGAPMLKYVVFVAFSCALFSHTLLAEDKPAFPVVDGKYVVIERMLVKEGYEQWFEDYWKNMVLPVFAEID